MSWFRKDLVKEAERKAKKMYKGYKPPVPENRLYSTPQIQPKTQETPEIEPKLQQTKRKNLIVGYRRTHAQIRDRIMDCLAKRPMSGHELHKTTLLHCETLKKHLAWLQTLGVVESKNIYWEGKQKAVWCLCR